MIWLINFAARLLSLLILLRMAASWLDPRRGSEYSRFVHVLADPLILPFRRLFFRRGMRLDLSPLAALIGIELLRGFLVLILGGVFV